MASAAQLTLGWDPVTGPVTGYKMYYGTKSGASGDFDYNVDVGSSTSCTISGLEEGATYYFAVTAYKENDGDADDDPYIESDFSKEISYTLYEDAEDGSTRGWKIYDNSPIGANIKNVYDNDRQSQVIHLSGSGIGNGFRLKNDDGTKWQNSNQFIIQWSMQYSGYFIIFIDVETTEGHRYLEYKPVDYDDLGNGEYVRFGIGSDANDGKWHTFIRELQADLDLAQPNPQILEVNGFLIRGSGKLDDIFLLNR